MRHDDLLSIRQDFTEKNILVCFNGPISTSLIEEIGNALKNYLDADAVGPSISTDVFSVYIELTQNVRHYAQKAGYGDIEGAATVVVGRDPDGRYRVLSGNMVERKDGEALEARIHELAEMDKAELKALYKKQLRAPRQDDAISGAGLGLISVARTAREPLACQLHDAGEGKVFFSLLALV